MNTNIILIILFFMSVVFTSADTIPSLGIFNPPNGKEKQKILNVMNVRTTRRTEKTGVRGDDRTITDYYTVIFPKPCKKCVVFHIVKGLGNYTTKVNGSSTSRPSFTSKSSIQTLVKKDSSIYCYSSDEGEGVDKIELKPLKEEQNYEYSSLSTGKGIGRPVRGGYTHKGFIVLVTWENEIKQAFSDIPELRNKARLNGTGDLEDYLSKLSGIKE